MLRLRCFLYFLSIKDLLCVEELLVLVVGVKELTETYGIVRPL